MDVVRDGGDPRGDLRGDARDAGDTGKVVFNVPDSSLLLPLVLAVGFRFYGGNFHLVAKNPQKNPERNKFCSPVVFGSKSKSQKETSLSNP